MKRTGRLRAAFSFVWRLLEERYLFPSAVRNLEASEQFFEWAGSRS